MYIHPSIHPTESWIENKLPKNQLQSFAKEWWGDKREACIRQRGSIESGKVNTNRMFQYFKHSPKQSLTGKLFKCKELYESGQTDRRTDRQIYRTTVQWTDFVKLELKVQRPQYYLQLQTDSRERVGHLDRLLDIRIVTCGCFLPSNAMDLLSSCISAKLWT